MAIHNKALKARDDHSAGQGSWPSLTVQEIARRQDEYRRGLSFEEIARRQGVRPVERIEDLLGGWPPEQIDDGFEEAVIRWRQAGLAVWNESHRDEWDEA